MRTHGSILAMCMVFACMASQKSPFSAQTCNRTKATAELKKMALKPIGGYKQDCVDCMTELGELVAHLIDNGILLDEESTSGCCCVAHNGAAPVEGGDACHDLSLIHI